MPEYVLEEVRDVLDVEGLAATPSNVYVADSGQLYVIDGPNRRVLILSADGELLQTMGREGDGPGEFTMPTTLNVSGDSLRVFDYVARRVKVFTSDGEFIRSYTVPDAGRGGWHAGFWPNGHLALPTIGFRTNHLVRRIDLSGAQVDSIGALVDTPVEVLDFNEIRSAAAERRLPHSLRHWVLPVPTQDGGLWLLLHADAVVHQYNDHGQLQHEFEMDVPEVEQLREQFFERNASMPAGTYSPLLTAMAGHAVQDKLWLLLPSEEGEPARFMIYADDGTLRYRMEVPEGTGTWSFTLSPDRGTLYLASQEQTRLLAVDLPEEFAAH